MIKIFKSVFFFVVVSEASLSTLNPCQTCMCVSSVGMDSNRLQICILVPDICQMILLYSIWLVPVFPRGWSTHLDSPDGRPDRLITFFFFFFFFSETLLFHCCRTSGVWSRCERRRRSRAVHTGLRLCSNSSITGVTLERSNLEREGERWAEGDKQIDRGWVSAGPTPHPQERLWPESFLRSRWCQRRIPECTQTRAVYDKTSASYSGGDIFHHNHHHQEKPMQQLHCGQNAPC